MMSSQIVPDTFYTTFLKFGKKNHLEAMLNQGHIYCNTCHFFATLEKNKDGRGDIYENVTSIKNGENMTMYIASANASEAKKEITLKVNNFQIREAVPSTDVSGNLFCLYGYNFLNDQCNFRYRMKVECEIDDYFIMILDADEFCRRIELALDQLGLEHSRGPVTYHDFKQHNGPRSAFQKDLAYQQQSEYRLFISNTRNDVLQFDIGSISDIAELRPLEDLAKGTYILAKREGFDKPQVYYSFEDFEPDNDEEC